MLEKIISFSIKHRRTCLLLTSIFCVIGVYNLKYLTIDAVPDITNVQVQINTEAEGYSPYEVEQRVTFPIETAISGLPNLDHVRSISRYGLSQITVVFKDNTDIYFARQLVNERILSARESLPHDANPSMGPISTGLGEIFQWAIYAQPGAMKSDGQPYTLMDLREIQDWIIKPQLRNVQGATEVNTIGGYKKQFHITPHPAKLVAYNLTFRDVLESLAKNNASVGTGYIERNGEQYLIRSAGQISNIDEINNIFLKNFKGFPIFIKDVANVELGKEQRTGAATLNAEESLIGTVFMLMGENGKDVSERTAAKMEEINRNLPKGVVVETVYNRTTLIDKCIYTVKKNLVEGAILVIVILFLFLGNFRAACIVACVIPISMLVTTTAMVHNKVSANLMSLGALDFGLIVDGAIIIVEFCISQLAEASHKLGRKLSLEERLDVVFKSATEVRKATIFGELIIMVVYLPILTLSGTEGKMFVPMAFTVLAALAGAMILSVTFVPAAVAIFLGEKIEEKENKFFHFFKKIYVKIFNYSNRNSSRVLKFSLIFVISCLLLMLNMGKEFIPGLDEGDATLQALRIPGTSLTQSIEMQKIMEKELLKIPEVKTVFSKIGTPEISSDPMPPNISDTYLIFKPKEEWPNSKRAKEEVVDSIKEVLDKIPGNKFEFSQPIQMRFNELLSGIRADVGIKIFGDDMEVLNGLGNQIASVVKNIPGAEDIAVEQVTGLPMLTIQLDKNRLSRMGINVSEVQDILEIALKGKEAGMVYEGDRRFELVVRMPESLRVDLDEIGRIPIPVPLHQEGEENDDRSASGLFRHITLDSIATIKMAPGPNQISRENGKRRLVVTANVRGTDLSTFVEKAQSIIKEQIKVPTGYWIDWGGQFEQMISAAKTLMIVVPLSLILIFAMLFATFKNVKDTLIIFSGVPLALTGGVLFIWIRGIPLSISAAVGFIALSGVAVLNGLVMISFINSLRKKGEDIDKAVKQGAFFRLRPVLMTAFTNVFGFLPMMFSTGLGAEMQRPLATVLIGGVLSSTTLTLVILPVLYKKVHCLEKFNHLSNIKNKIPTITQNIVRKFRRRTSK